MSNYTKLTDFAAKDALASGNPSKIVKGTEIDDEFAEIVIHIATKADTASPTFTGTPTTPTAATGSTTTQIASTAFVQQELDVFVPAGAIMLFGMAVPSAYLTCDGSAVSRAGYADLFSAIGTTFGVGDGSTTFNLPNLTADAPTNCVYGIKV